MTGDLSEFHLNISGRTNHPHENPDPTGNSWHEEMEHAIEIQQHDSRASTTSASTTARETT
jgi:hypothetical protein